MGHYMLLHLPFHWTDAAHPPSTHSHIYHSLVFLYNANTEVYRAELNRFLGPEYWENSVPNIRKYSLTESEAEDLTSYWLAYPF